MRVTLEILIEAECFDTSEAQRAEEPAETIGGHVYTWKTLGKHNWLERGYRIVDAIGLVVLPEVVPNEIEMLDDGEKQGFDGRNNIQSAS